MFLSEGALMKKFSQYMVFNYEDVKPVAKPTPKQMKDYVYHHVLNTDKPHDVVKKGFVTKFGSHNLKHFDKHVSSIVD